MVKILSPHYRSDTVIRRMLERLPLLKWRRRRLAANSTGTTRRNGGSGGGSRNRFKETLARRWRRC